MSFYHDDELVFKLLKKILCWIKILIGI